MKVGEHGHLPGKQFPGKLHPSLRLPYVPGWLELGLDDPLPFPPEILNGVLVRALADSGEDRNVLLFQQAMDLLEVWQVAPSFMKISVPVVQREGWRACQRTLM